MHIAESVAIASVEKFLSGAQLKDLRTALLPLLEQTERGELSERARGASVHSIEGHSVSEAMSIYEPEGRAESVALPKEATRILDAAGERALPRIRRLLPTAAGFSPWIFVSYGKGQYITPHIDLMVNDDDPDLPKVAGIGIPLTPARDYEGGEFFVETTTDPSLWDGGAPGDPPRTRHDCDASSAWFRSLPRTRWRTKPDVGDAVLYGSQLTHGTEPVRSGRVSKVIGFLTS